MHYLSGMNWEEKVKKLSTIWMCHLCQRILIFNESFNNDMKDFFNWHFSKNQKKIHIITYSSNRVDYGLKSGQKPAILYSIVFNQMYTNFEKKSYHKNMFECGIFLIQKFLLYFPSTWRLNFTHAPLLKHTTDKLKINLNYKMCRFLLCQMNKRIILNSGWINSNARIVCVCVQILLFLVRSFVRLLA